MLANLISSIAGTDSSIISAVSHWPWLVGAAYLSLLFALISVSRLPFIVRLSLALTLTSQIVPVSYVYSLTFVFVVVGELVGEAVSEWESAQSGHGIHVWMATPLAVAVTLTLAPNPVPLPNRLSSFATILVPASSLALALSCAAWLRWKAPPSGLDLVHADVTSKSFS